MYTQLRESFHEIGTPTAATETATTTRPRVSRNVFYLSLTSLFTDISSEMISAILPLYFVSMLRLTPLQFGIIDGLYQSIAALMRLTDGLITDRSRHYKEITDLGYALSAICKLDLLTAGSVWTTLAT